MRRAILSVIAVAALLLPAHAASARPLPDRIPLPNGFLPEGIAITSGGTFYTGSLIDGSIYRGDVRSGLGIIFIHPPSGRIAVGMKVHKKLLYVAGGDTGDAYVYDTRTGVDVRVYSFSPGGFINDVVVTKEAAWFTDSFFPFLYKVPITRNGIPGDPSSVEAIPLTGDIVYQDGFNVNGIDATPNGKTLIIVQTNTGKLFTVPRSSGVTSEIDLGSEDVVNGDGILLDGRDLFVVQGFSNLLARVRLAPDLSSGEVVSRTGDDDFDIPTTVAEAGSTLYLVNARFTTPPTPDTEYWISPITKP
ncbi:MAG TPA: superoxide dismutase [Actinomycetota bacterium]